MTLKQIFAPISLPPQLVRGERNRDLIKTKIGQRTLFIFLFLILNLSLVSAQGIAISPDRLYFDENNFEREITIFNLNNEKTEYFVSVKENLELFEINPEKIIIEKDKSKKVTIRLNEIKESFEDIIYVRENSKKDLLPGIGIRIFVKKEFYDGKGIALVCLALLAGVVIYVKFKY